MSEKDKDDQQPVIKRERDTGPTSGSLNEMDRMLEAFFGRSWPKSWMHPFHWEFPSWSETSLPYAGRLPRVDIIDSDDTITVKAEIPGVSKDDLDISTTENTVTIRGRTSHEFSEEKGDYFRAEMSRGEFSRTIALPSPIDSEKAKANLENGILELTLPKAAKAKRHSIEVK